MKQKVKPNNHYCGRARIEKIDINNDTPTEAIEFLIKDENNTTLFSKTLDVQSYFQFDIKVSDNADFILFSIISEKELEYTLKIDYYYEFTPNCYKDCFSHYDNINKEISAKYFLEQVKFLIYL